MKWFWKAIMFVSLVTSLEAKARFSHEDSTQIDHEEEQDVETINDSLSYRYPVGWRESFFSANRAFRVSAGSLSANRFEYLEDVRLLSNRTEVDYAVEFEQAAREDYFEQSRHQQISFDGRTISSLWLGILGESGSYKEYGDLGVRLSWWHDLRHYIEVKYWSVDHYFSTKKSDQDDDRTQETNSIEVNALWNWNARNFVRLAYSYDEPLKWLRPNRGYSYSVKEQILATEISIELSPEDALMLSSNYSTKSEAKDGLSHFAGQTKSMSREHMESELRWQRYQSDSTVLEVGFINLNRKALYEQNGLLNAAEPMESLSPTRVSRQEQATFLTHNGSGFGISDRFQWGLFINRVQLSRFEEQSEVEVKAQTAWEFRHGNDAHVFFNLTWDLDRLVENYPYEDSDHPANPWGGGNIQFMLLL